MSHVLIRVRPIVVGRYVGPVGPADRTRYQFSLSPGRVDGCGERVAWASIDLDELERLVAVLQVEVAQRRR